jgi:hypothetical protein
MNASDIRMSARKVADALFGLDVEHIKDGATGEEILFNLHTVIVGKNDEGEDVTGGLVARATITAAGAAGRPRSAGLTDRQLRVIQELTRDAAVTKRWEWTTEEFNEICVRCGAVDHDAPDSTKRVVCARLRTQLANKGSIAVSGSLIRLIRQT